MNSLKSIKRSMTAAKSILGDVIPSLEDIAEEPKNELRKARIILKEGLEHFKQPTREDGIPVHVVQYEHGGIPDDPYLTLDYDKALLKYQELLVQQGFREMREHEDLRLYAHEYESALQGNLYEKYPKFKTEDTVRWWDIEVE